jgi:carbon-monoxide dehydrogenase medium subunit
MKGTGEIGSAAIALTNVAETPLYAEAATRLIVGSKLDAATVKLAVTAAEAITAPASDRRGTPQYRTRMAGVMVARALAQAAQRARGG